MRRPFARRPQDWHFNDADRARYASTHWQVPISLVQPRCEGLEGIWPSLWRDRGTVRGGGTVASVLPVLCLHTWPDKRRGADPDSSGDWTAWQYLSYRRIARLAGVTPETVGQVFRRLAAIGLLEARSAPPPDHFGGPPRKAYRLSTMLYPQGKERFATLSGPMIYGGHWAFLPTAAARQLYIAVACLQAVQNEAAYLAKRDLEPGTLMAEDVLNEVRERRPQSIEALARATGMSRPTVAEALEVLRTSVEKYGPYVEATPALRSGMFSYAIKEPEWHWTPDFLNESPERWRTNRLRYWPFLERPRAVRPLKRAPKGRRSA